MGIFLTLWYRCAFPLSCATVTANKVVIIRTWPSKQLFIQYTSNWATWRLCSSSRVSTQTRADLSLGRASPGGVGCVSWALFLLLLVSGLALNRVMRGKGCWRACELLSKAEENLSTGRNMEIVITDSLTDFILGLWKLCLQSFGLILFQWNFTPGSQGILVPSAVVLHCMSAKRMSPLPCTNTGI